MTVLRKELNEALIISETVMSALATTFRKEGVFLSIADILERRVQEDITPLRLRVQQGEALENDG